MTRVRTLLSTGMLSCAIALGALTSVGTLTSCAKGPEPAPPGTLRYTEEARIAYEQAMRLFNDRSWESAKKAFTKVKTDYAQSRYARWAELRLADIMFEQDELPEALGAFRAFMQSHRLDVGAPYAHYRVCQALFGQISDTLMLPPQEERDQAIVLDTYRELHKFKEMYPSTRWDEQIDYMLLDVTGRLVRYELYVARFYLKRDNFEAASARARYALANYHNSGMEPEALVLLGETQLKLKQNTEAKKTFEKVVSDYPGSPFVASARKFLEHISTL